MIGLLIVVMKQTLLNEIEKLKVLLELKTSFKWNEFKNIKSHKEQYRYALQHLPGLGQGSSRRTFQLGNSSKVLKVAVNTAGLAQNKAEVDVYTNPVTKRVVTKTFDFEPNYGWLVAEAVRPIDYTDSDEAWFYKKVGLPWNTYIKFLHANKETNNPFVLGIRSIMKATGLLVGDIAVMYHYGKTADDRMVLLDYGYTEEVKDKHYGLGIRSQPLLTGVEDQNARKEGQYNLQRKKEAGVQKPVLEPVDDGAPL